MIGTREVAGGKKPGQPCRHDPARYIQPVPCQHQKWFQTLQKETFNIIKNGKKEGRVKDKVDVFLKVKVVSLTTFSFSGRSK